MTKIISQLNPRLYLVLFYIENRTPPSAYLMMIHVVFLIGFNLSNELFEGKRRELREIREKSVSPRGGTVGRE